MTKTKIYPLGIVAVLIANPIGAQSTNDQVNLKIEAGKIAAAGDCEGAQQLALTNGDFELAAKIKSYCSTKATSNQNNAEIPTQVTLPQNTRVPLMVENEITSKKMKEGTKRSFIVAEDVAYEGVVVIPRGSHVTAIVTWRTGKGIVGKSAKFELSFDSVDLGEKSYRLKGKHRQEGRGNTAGALLGAGFITGRSAVMTPGQLVNAFTAEDITIGTASDS